MTHSVTSKMSLNVCKSSPKMISLEKLNILTPLQELSKNVRDLGKLIVSKGLEMLPKVQKIAQSGHADDPLELATLARMGQRLLCP